MTSINKKKETTTTTHRVQEHERFCVVLSETGSDRLHVIAEEVSRVANVLRNSDAVRAYNIEEVKNREFAVSPSQPFVEQTMQCRLTQKFGFGIFAPKL